VRCALYRFGMRGEVDGLRSHRDRGRLYEAVQPVSERLGQGVLLLARAERPAHARRLREQTERAVGELDDAAFKDRLDWQ